MRVPYFIRIFYEPTSTLLAQKKESSFFLAFINFALTGANVGVLGILFLDLSLQTVGSSSSFWEGVVRLIQHVREEGIVVFIIIPFLSGLLTAIVGFLFAGFVWASAHMLGGRGAWKENAHLISILFLPVAIGTFFLNLTVIVPEVGIILSAGWWIYVFYLASRAISVANTLSLVRGTIALLIPSTALLVIMTRGFSA